mmetsp:Transcript_104465/g.202396  ORF Transcript_104465/g.202396 Transcript_104465/m.202396 type:complete len:228 (+) Transcript_104465:63-746(+)
MPLKVYAIGLSQPARAVHWALLAEGTDHEIITTMPGSNKENGTKHPNYLAKFPFGTVPAIDHDGYCLSESHAILTYLGDTFNWKLYPKDIKLRGRINEILHWHHRNTRQISIALFAPVVRPDLGIKVETVKALTKELGAIFGQFESWLTTSKFLCGDEPTIADIAAYCEIGQCAPEYCNLFDFSSYPSIQRWLQVCKQIPGHAESHVMLAQMGPKIASKAKALRSKL